MAARINPCKPLPIYSVGSEIIHDAVCIATLRFGQLPYLPHPL
jgi:hypothetical protein